MHVACVAGVKRGRGRGTKPSMLATVTSEFGFLNKNQPEETDKMCREINSQQGTL